ncbi:O-antigen ligase family protein, partial [Leifsonia sp. SIMBA_070]
MNNYPIVEAMVSDRPAFGMGPNTYIVTNAIRITDNQYLKTAVEMGLVGVLALLAYFLLAALASLLAGVYFRDDAGWR